MFPFFLYETKQNLSKIPFKKFRTYFTHLRAKKGSLLSGRASLESDARSRRAFTKYIRAKITEAGREKGRDEKKNRRRQKSAETSAEISSCPFGCLYSALTRSS